MKKLFLTVAALAALVATGCATRSANIVPGDASHLQYSNLNCGQLSVKMSSTKASLTALSKKQDRLATTDEVAMSVGLFLFWPALIVNAATPDHEKEIAQLKGDYEAIEMVMISKNCGADYDPHNYARK